MVLPQYVNIRFCMQTQRQMIKELLLEGVFSSLELSQRLSMPGPGRRFRTTPAVCNNCGFAFKKRERLTTPSRCPLCHRESIRRPRFALLRE